MAVVRASPGPDLHVEVVVHVSVHASRCRATGWLRSVSKAAHVAVARRGVHSPSARVAARSLGAWGAVQGGLGARRLPCWQPPARCGVSTTRAGVRLACAQAVAPDCDGKEHSFWFGETTAQCSRELRWRCGH